MPPKIIVQDYDPRWPEQFIALKQVLWPAVSDLALAIEHVGSTAVPGLAAKPVIDIDIVIASARDLALITPRLRKLGYEPLGNLGIEEREAYRAPAGPIAHHLYVCLTDCVALKNHLLLRDHLRNDANARVQYAELKRELAKSFSDSIDDYISGKTGFILNILNKQGLEPNQLHSIRAANSN